MAKRAIVSVRTLSDIRSALQPFLKESKEPQVSISTEMTWHDDDGKRQKGLVKSESRDLSLRRMLLEGFDLVKKRVELAKKAKAQSELEDDDDDLLPEKIRWGLFNIDDQYLHVDSLIRKELGGKRKGLRVRWEVVEGKFEFDPYSNDLYRVTDE